jgi:hypothetical protein
VRDHAAHVTTLLAVKALLLRSSPVLPLQQ